jgi:chromate transport protein ChrA
MNDHTLADLVRYFLWLGTTGFGGPIALCGAMQRDLVDDRKWCSKEDYAEGLALAQLAPGPLAAQLAIYLGWVEGGTFGATLVGLAFVLPRFWMNDFHWLDERQFLDAVAVARAGAHRPGRPGGDPRLLGLVSLNAAARGSGQVADITACERGSGTRRSRSPGR